MMARPQIAKTYICQRVLNVSTPHNIPVYEKRARQGYLFVTDILGMVSDMITQDIQSEKASSAMFMTAELNNFESTTTRNGICWGRIHTL